MSIKKLDAALSKLSKQTTLDGWFNVLTNVGVQGKDKMSGGRITPTFLTRATIESAFQACDISAKIIERLPNDMMREGYKIITKENKAHGEDILKAMEVFGVNEKINEALVEARMYGGAALIIGVQDGKTMDQPLDYGAIDKITFVTVLDRHQLTAGSKIDSDLSSSNFGRPESYSLSAGITVGTQTGKRGVISIHHSRMVRFYGVKVPKNLRARTEYWGDSVLSRVIQVINNYTHSHQAIASLVADFNKLVLSLSRLEKMLAQGKDDLVVKRLKLIALMSSVVNAIVLQDGDKLENRTINLSGLSDLMKLIGNRLVAATEMTHTILLGESPDGSNATGNSTTMQWYDHVKNKQKACLTPPLSEVVKFFMSAKDSATKGTIVPFEIKYNPLWQLDDKEKADLRLKTSQADQIDIQENIITSSEVRESRYGEGAYSIDTFIDENVDPLLENAAMEEDDPNQEDDQLPPDKQSKGKAKEGNAGGSNANPSDKNAGAEAY